MSDRSATSSFTFSDREMPVRFGRYHLLKRLSADPVGEEFLAAWGVDEGVDQLRVVRCVYPKIAEEVEFVGLFSEEARSLSRLSSANVVRVMEVGREGDIPFVAREHVEGVALDRLVSLAADRTLLWPWELAAHVTAELLRGLDYVHRREDLHGQPMGMRHGDVRPANVLVSFNGEVRLTNFGSSLRFIADERTNARLSELRGRFLPPEGVDEHFPTVAADLWGGATILLAMLGGRLPSSRPAQSDAPLQPWTPPAMSMRVEAMPPVIDSFLVRALNPDLEYRYPTAAEMRAALVGIMGEHVTGHPPDDLAAWVREIADADRRAEAELVRRVLRAEPKIVLDAASQGASALGPGSVLDHRYHLIRKLGEGGMGVIYEAEHLGLGRKVAIKVLHERVIDDDNALERFRREAQIIGSLGHPNIVAASDFGETAEGYHYLAMELLEGVSMSERIADRSLSARDIARIAAEVCDGLQAAHEAHIVHRDLKPDNIFLTQSGARIPDFGIAKSTGLDAETESLTRTGNICGTAEYIAPEQIRGLHHDPRSDLYAVGVIIYEALTGETPFRGRTVGETLFKSMNDKLVPPGRRCGDKTIPPALEAICMKALQRRADKRFASAAEMAAALRGLLPAKGAVARPAARRRRPLAIWIAAAIAVVVGTAWAVSRMAPAPREPVSPEPDRPAQSESPVPPPVPAVSEVPAVPPPPSQPFVEVIAEAPPRGAEDAEDGRALALDRALKGEKALAAMRFDEAQEAFEEAVRLDTRLARAWMGLAKVAFQRGDYATALAKAERAARGAPGNATYRNYAGRIHLAAGRRDEAVATWRDVLAASPGNAEATRLLEKAGEKVGP
ncbi:MAG: protein kinase [Proteobacteria bacterium]|jgi:serine/threonine-protein kinase|nr:protein kinase [Pseudomonadota bacterium]